MKTSFVMGLDLGPPGQPTGFAILERTDRDGQEPHYGYATWNASRPARPIPA